MQRLHIMVIMIYHVQYSFEAASETESGPELSTQLYAKMNVIVRRCMTPFNRTYCSIHTTTQMSQIQWLNPGLNQFWRESLPPVSRVSRKNFYHDKSAWFVLLCAALHGYLSADLFSWHFSMPSLQFLGKIWCKLWSLQRYVWLCMHTPFAEPWGHYCCSYAKILFHRAGVACCSWVILFEHLISCQFPLLLRHSCVLQSCCLSEHCSTATISSEPSYLK